MKGCLSGQWCLVMATGVCNVNAGQGKQDVPSPQFSYRFSDSPYLSGMYWSGSLLLPFHVYTNPCTKTHTQTHTPTLRPPFNFHSHFLHLTTAQLRFFSIGLYPSILVKWIIIALWLSPIIKSSVNTQTSGLFYNSYFSSLLLHFLNSRRSSQNHYH